MSPNLRQRLLFIGNLHRVNLAAVHLTFGHVSTRRPERLRQEQLVLLHASEFRFPTRVVAAHRRDVLLRERFLVDVRGRRTLTRCSLAPLGNTVPRPRSPPLPRRLPLALHGIRPARRVRVRPGFTGLVRQPGVAVHPRRRVQAASTLERRQLPRVLVDACRPVQLELAWVHEVRVVLHVRRGKVQVRVP